VKVVIFGGTGQLGQILARTFVARGDAVVVVARGAAPGARVVPWDGFSLGPWTAELDGADAVVNLAGRSVNCRYTAENMHAMMSSRVDSTRIVGQAIERAHRPPGVWLQMSTATIYAHRFDAPNDELTGRIGGDEPGVPAYWAFSVDIAKNWERAQAEANTPGTRKLALRTSMVLSPDRGGVFDVLLGLTRTGLGGSIAGGRQYLSWIHDHDFARAVVFLLEREELRGAVNVCSPNPLPQAEFMSELRRAWGTRLGLPATRWMVEIGAFFLRTDSELTLKSRRVVPKRLLDAGFRFEHADWPGASQDLVRRWRSRRAGAAQSFVA
jgi:uncharacterized protein (TIGR01777 family)